MQRVTNDDEVTEWKEVSQGVPQGSCLSPILFNIYVRKLPSTTTFDSFQYADDITHSEADHIEENVIERLTNTFQSTKDFCDAKELTINMNKTQFIIFKSPNRRISDELTLTLDGCTIKPADDVKLIGVQLDKHLTFGKHFDYITNKCNGIIGALSRAAPHLPQELVLMAYTALIRSHLEYCSAIFASASKTQLTKLDIIQKKS